MPDAHHLLIAGVRLSIRAQAGAVVTPVDPVYEAFCPRPEVPAGDLALPIELTAEPPLDPRTLAPLFSTGTWTAYRAGATRWLFAAHQPGGQPLWAAHLDETASRVTVHCAPVAAANDAVENPVRYPLDQLLLGYALARPHGLILHAAGVAIAGQGILFGGRSGAGKTTWAVRLAATSRSVVLSDDRMIVRPQAGGWQAYGTPWPGDGGFAVNRGVPLRALCFVQQSPEDALHPLSPAAALRELLPIASLLWYDPDFLPPMLAACDELVRQVPCYQLGLSRNADAEGLLQQLMPQ